MTFNEIRQIYEEMEAKNIYKSATVFFEHLYRNGLNELEKLSRSQVEKCLERSPEITIGYGPGKDFYQNDTLEWIEGTTMYMLPMHIVYNFASNTVTFFKDIELHVDEDYEFLKSILNKFFLNAESTFGKNLIKYQKKDLSESITVSIEFFEK